MLPRRELTARLLGAPEYAGDVAEVEREHDGGRCMNVRIADQLGDHALMTTMHAVEDADGDHGALELARHLVEATPQRWDASRRCHSDILPFGRSSGRPASRARAITANASPG